MANLSFFPFHVDDDVEHYRLARFHSRSKLISNHHH
jgi:hypothetical protein